MLFLPQEGFISLDQNFLFLIKKKSILGQSLPIFGQVWQKKLSQFTIFCQILKNFAELNRIKQNLT